ncbi:hypothetical protein ACOBR2_06400 [Telmatobacter bradus]|uniref:hypothetical protein n=1 Tax=Telmatobacter bradus TaxID=474953 RepID=UPI003B42A3EE
MKLLFGNSGKKTNGYNVWVDNLGGGGGSSKGGTGANKAISGMSHGLIGGLLGKLNDSDALGRMFGGHLFGSGSFFGNMSSHLPAFADGGSISSGMPSLIGERGPEIFVPTSSGRIIPNNQIGKYGSQGGTPTYTIDARGTDAAMVHQAVYRGMTMAHAQAVNDSVKSLHDQARRTPR